MSHVAPPAPRLQSSETTGWDVLNNVSEFPRVQRVSIHILDDDSLLHIFAFYRPVLLDGDETDNATILQGGEWNRERWWYKLAQVCQRWRHLILASSSSLGLYLVCAHGTPVTDMLAQSPPLPLIIDHIDRQHVYTAEDEARILLALQHRDRIRRIRLHLPVPILQRLITAMDEEFPSLEYLYVAARMDQIPCLKLPELFQAPHIRHLILIDFAFPLTPPLLPPTVGPVTLWLSKIPPSSYIPPNVLLHQLSIMPQLETLGIFFHSPISDHEIERQLVHIQIMTCVTLPNLRWFLFGGVSAYLEALLPWMTAPVLDKLQIFFFSQPTFSVPHLHRFTSTTENLRANGVIVAFDNTSVFMTVYHLDNPRRKALYLDISARPLDRQVASAAQIFDALGSWDSIIYGRAPLSLLPEANSVVGWEQANHTHWCELLRPFTNVRTMQVTNGLVRELSNSLQRVHGETLRELLPELRQLRYTVSHDTGDAFTAFINARRDAFRPVTLVNLTR